MFPLGGAAQPAAAGGGAGPQEPPPAADGTEDTNLSSYLDKPGCYCKNENKSYPWTNLFIGDSRLGLQSDADEQLIMHFEFQEFVKVKSIKFTEFNNGADPELAPVTVHVHVNRVNLGFEDIEDVEPTQTFTMTLDNLRSTAPPMDLFYVKFQRVKSLTFFVEDNAGGDVTAIGGLEIMGRTVATTKMNDFKSRQ